MSREFNPIYKALVTDDKDLAGLCAYAVYKREKIEKIESYKLVNNKEPDDDYLDDFHKQSMNKLDKYRKEGNKNCESMIAYVVGKAVQNKPNVVQKATDKTGKQKDEEKKNPPQKGTFWPNVWSGFLAKLFWAIVPIIVLLLGLVTKPQLTLKLVKITHPEIIEELMHNESNTEPADNVNDTSF